MHNALYSESTIRNNFRRLCFESDILGHLSPKQQKDILDKLLSCENEVEAIPVGFIKWYSKDLSMEKQECINDLVNEYRNR